MYICIYTKNREKCLLVGYARKSMMVVSCLLGFDDGDEYVEAQVAILLFVLWSLETLIHVYIYTHTFAKDLII